MSNDNDPRDDAMREIEAALEAYSQEVFNHASDETLAVYETALLALIRSKLPQPDAEIANLPKREKRFAPQIEAIEEGFAQIDRGESLDIDKWQDELRQKVDAEHERAVEAWAAKFDSAMLSFSHDWGLPDDEAHKPFGVAERHAEIRACFHEALRLMRARPASGKDEAAGELLRAAKAARDWLIEIDEDKDAADLGAAIAKAERAGIKP